MTHATIRSRSSSPLATCPGHEPAINLVGDGIFVYIVHAHFHGSPKPTFRAVFPLSCRASSTASGTTRRLRPQHYSAFQSTAKRDWDPLRGAGRERRFSGVLATLSPAWLAGSGNLRRET